MKGQFNWLFPAKESDFFTPQTQTLKPCFRNFDFQVHLSFNRKGHAPVYMQVQSVNNVYACPLIPKQTTQR